MRGQAAALLVGCCTRKQANSRATATGPRHLFRHLTAAVLKLKLRTPTPPLQLLAPAEPLLGCAKLWSVALMGPAEDGSCESSSHFQDGLVFVWRASSSNGNTGAVLRTSQAWRTWELAGQPSRVQQTGDVLHLLRVAAVPAKAPALTGAALFYVLRAEAASLAGAEAAAAMDSYGAPEGSGGLDLSLGFFDFLLSADDTSPYQSVPRWVERGGVTCCLVHTSAARRTRAGSLSQLAQLLRCVPRCRSVPLLQAAAPDRASALDPGTAARAQPAGWRRVAQGRPGVGVAGRASQRQAGAEVGGAQPRCAAGSCGAGGAAQPALVPAKAGASRPAAEEGVEETARVPAVALQQAGTVV